MKTLCLLPLILVVQMTASQDHQRLGDEYMERGDFSSAMREYQQVPETVRHRDPSLLKQIATLNERTRHFTQAAEWWGKAIAANPSDAEAMDGLQALQAQRSLRIEGGYGGGEIDYSNKSYNINGFYGGVDWLDLHGGYSRNDKIAYARTNTWLDAYAFPSCDTYLRLGVQRKHYDYPQSAGSSPDNNAYLVVPDYQIEIAHYTGENYVSIELEYFTPNFFWNQDLRANNLKLGGTIRNWLLRPLYFKFFASTLRDPDPQTFVADAGTGGITGFQYERVAMVGGALGLENGRWNVEIKYVPDRDLDHSLDWSMFGKITFEADRLGVQYDFLYDRYSRSSSNSFQSSQAHMVSMTVEPTRMFAVRAGVKILARESTTLNPFISFRIKTGV
jgi:tetratricopeptide (TPR) repeat protein